MKISYNWLKDHIELTETAEEISAKLTKAGLEVEKTEAFETIKGGLRGIVIGQVLSCERIPETEKLKKTTVDIGNGVVIPIVCGASNVATGQKVIVATVDAMLYPVNGEPFKIKKAKLKGEPSEGMICAEDEIGLGISHDGIMVLDTTLPAGTPASHYFNIESDNVFEIGLTPNRADAASHFGVARDLKAIFKRAIKKVDVASFKADNNSKPVQVVIENKDACPRYCGLTISGVKVEASPAWLQNRLKSIGLNPINNIVDITNFILHDLGQPLHAFDLEKVKGNKVIIKNATQGETFVTLDGTSRKLKSTDLMICNAEEPMCIAGVFGGLHSGVSSTTKNIFLESAYFSADAVRNTAMYHGLKTDSSFRFERGTDPNMPLTALKKAAMLIKEIAGGEISSEAYDIYPTVIEDFAINTSYGKINELIGKVIPSDLVKEILQNLQIEIKEEKGDTLKLSVPPFKVDVKKEADIVEEVLRIYGYDNIELSDVLSTSYLATFPEKDKEKIQRNISVVLTSDGFSEIITNSLTSPVYAEKLQVQQSSVHILNKLSEELGVMRQSLLFSGLEVVAHNVNRRQKDLKLFEFGKTYSKTETGYAEKNYLGLFITGDISQESWQQASKITDYHFANGIIVKTLAALNLHNQIPQPCEHIAFEKGYAYKKGEKNLVSFGAVKSDFLKQAEIKQPVFYVEFDMDLILKVYKNDLVFEEISKFPEVRRDLSLVLDKKITFEEIQKIAKKTEKKLISAINVFDVYEGKNIGEGKKSYSISFTLLDHEQTLTDKLIDQTMEKLMKALEGELGAVIRK